jgi:hypothetical protein
VYDPGVTAKVRSCLGIAALYALLVCCATTAQATASQSAGASGPVVLGAPAFAPNGTGWGKAHPSEIFNGGDPSGLVTDIHWRTWGGPTAIGFGRNAIFKPGGGYYRKQVRIKLRAESLGNCGGRRAYTRLSVRVPARPGGPLRPWRSWAGAGTICAPPSY